MLTASRTSFVAALFTALMAVAGCSSAQSASEADDTYHQALAKSQGDTMGAIKLLEDGLGQYPSHAKMRFLLARLQYDTGEIQHVEERRSFQSARKAEEEGHPGDVQKFEHEAQDHHAKALPFYRACRENLKIVVSNTDDTARQGWAYTILMRCDIFFEEYKQAASDLEKAIELGKPQGEKLQEMQEFLSQLKTLANTGKKSSPFN